MNDKESEIQQILVQSFFIISNPFEKSKNITIALRFIEGYQVKEDYGYLLIKIIQDPKYCIATTLSALTQLKVLIQSYWKQDNENCHEYCLSPNVKKYVMSQLFPLIFQLEDNYTYTRFLMEIFKQIGEHLCQELVLSCNIGQQFTDNINNEQYFRQCLILFLGICKKYQNKHYKTEITSFNSLLEIYWPIILKRVVKTTSKIKGENEEDKKKVLWQKLYLSMKISCKCIKNSTSLKSKMFSFQWAQIAIYLLKLSDYFIAQSGIFQWNNGTTQFYIHHTYKWSLKYLTIFTCSKLFINRNTPKELCSLVNQYMHQKYPDLINFVCELLTKIRIEKERYHEVDLLRVMVNIEQNFFRKQIRKETSLILCHLLPIMELTQIDKDIVENSPQTFLEYQFNGENQIFPIESPRQEALAIWKRIIGMAQKHPNQVSQHILQTAFAQLEKLWESSDSQKRQVCFKLLAYITPNSNHKYLEKYLRSFAQSIPICLNNGGWPAVRALQFFANTKLQIQGKTLEYIHLWIQNKILCSDHPRGVQVLLVVFSCLCLNRLYSQYDEIKQKALKSNFQAIFDKIILEVLKQNPCEKIMHCVKELAAIGLEHIMIQNSIRTAIILKDLIFQYLAKQNETNDRNKQDQYTEMIIEASDTITFIVSIMSSQYKRQVETNQLSGKTIGLQKELENVILSLFFRVMEENVEDYEQFIQFISPLLSSYLHTFTPNNQNFIIILRGLVLRITGINKQIVDSFKNISQAQYKILSQCSLTDLKQELSPYLPIFRNILKYIPLSPETIIREPKQLFSNFLSVDHFELILFLADSFYIKEAQQKGEYNHGKCLSSLLIIYILEIKGSNIPQNILGWIFNRILFMVNQINKTSFMLKYIIQIFLLWISIQEDEQLQATIESIPTQTRKKFMKTLFMNPKNKGFPQFQDNIFEWKRVTLGLAKLLNIKTGNPHLQLFVEDQVIISWLIFSTYKIFENSQKYFENSRDQDRVSRLAYNFSENQENEIYELSEKQSIVYQINDSNHDFYEQPIDRISLSVNCLKYLTKYQNTFREKYNSIVKLDQDNNDYLQHILSSLLDRQIYEFQMNQMEYLDLADQEFYSHYIEQKTEGEQIQYYSRMYE